MNIYVDFDDCLCETARYFSKLAKELFGINVPYEKIRYFDLQKSFELTDEEYDKLMVEGHTPQALLSYDKIPGAVEAINSWIDEGYEVSIVTGRPVSCYEPSRQWLNEHGLERVPMYCLDKYGRDTFLKGSTFTLELEDYYKMKFDFAVEDSPAAFKFFNHLPDLKVLVPDRPWNRECEFPNKNFTRCKDWSVIRELVKDKDL